MDCISLSQMKTTNDVPVSASANADRQLAAKPLAVDVSITDNSIIHSPARISSQLLSVTSFKLSRFAETERGDTQSRTNKKHLHMRCAFRAVSENILEPEVLLSDRPDILQPVYPLPGYVITSRR